jgi:glycosyltransferase involved in cell wall biosynthesis
MKIGIVALSLFETRGGIERVACNLAAAMMERGYTVCLFFKQPSRVSASPLYPPPKGAALVGLDLYYDTMDIELARALVRAQNLDVLVALFLWESLLWIPALLVGTSVRLVISEHSEPGAINSKWDAYEREHCLFCADRIHVLSPRFMGSYPVQLHPRMEAIPNPAYMKGTSSQKNAEKKRFTLLGGGRFLEKVKQFSLLMRAFHLLYEEFPDWDMEICGDGEAYREYETLVEELGLAGRVRLPGMIADVSPHYVAADIFCIPSRVEGLPMVTVEAQYYALPVVVGFAECPGTNEIVVHGENGLLAEEMTPECLAASLAVLMRDASLRERLGERGKQMFVRYDPENRVRCVRDVVPVRSGRPVRTAHSAYSCQRLRRRRAYAGGQGNIAARASF